MMKRNGKITGLACALLSFLGTFCLPYVLNLKGEGLAVSNSWFGVFAWAALWFVADRAMDGRRKGDRRGKAAALLLGGTFSLCLVFGVSLERAENVDFGDGMMWFSATVWAFIFPFG